MSLLILCAFLSLVIPAMLLVACVANRLRFLRTCSLIVRTIDPVAAWSIALIFAVFCQTLVPIAAVRGHNFGVPFLPTQLPSLVAWYKQQGVTTGYNGAASFASASSESLSVADNASLRMGNVDAWGSVWFSTTTASGSPTIYAKDGSSAGATDYYFFLNSGKPTISIYNTSTAKTAQWGTSLSTNTFYHAFWWFDSVAQTVNIVVNAGTPVSTSTAGFTPTAKSTKGLIIGADTISSPGDFFDGELDVALYGKNVVGGFATTPASTIYNALYAAGNGLAAKDITAAQNTAWGTIFGYDFDGPGNLTKDYIGSNTLTASGTPPTYVQGKVLTNNFVAGDGGGVTNTLGNQTTDGAASFASASSEKFSTSTLWFPATGAASVSCWASFATLGTTTALLANGQSTTSFFLGKNASNKVGLSVNNAALSVVSSTAIADSNEHHIVGVYDGTNVSVYLDGNLVAGPTAQIMSSPSADTGTIGGFTASGFVNGTIDALTTYQGALTAGDVTKLNAAGNGVAAKDTAALGLSKTATAGYDFDGPGNLTKDYIGSNTLTASGTPPTYGAGQVASYTIADGDVVTTWQDQAAPPIKAQGAASFASASSEQYTRANFYATLGNVSFSCWAKFTTLGTQTYFFVNGPTGSWAFLKGTNDKVEFSVNGVSTAAVASSAIVDNNWHFLVGTYDSTSVRLYIDNVLVGGPTVSTQTTPSGLFSLGAYPSGSQFMDGQLDAAIMFSGLLTVSDIGKLWNSGNGLAAKDVATAGLSVSAVCGYDFDNSYNLGRDSIGTNILTASATPPTITTGQVKSSTIICGDQTTGNNLTQATAANRPIYKVNVQNGRPVVQFNGTSQYLATSGNVTLIGTVCIAGVGARPWTTAKYAPLMTCGYTSTVGVALLTTGGTSQDWQTKWLAGIGGGYTTGNAPRRLGSYGTLTDNTFHYLATNLGTASGTNDGTWLDGSEIDSVNAAGAVPTVTAPLQLGASSVQSNWWDNQIGEAVLYQAASGGLTKNQVAGQLYNYFKGGWATP